MRRLNRPRAVRTAFGFRKSFGVRHLIEPLESRTLLNATLTSAIAPIDVSLNASPTAISLGSHFDDPTVTGTAVEVGTQLGNFTIALFDQQAPKTVANFLKYVNNGLYADAVIHRVLPGLILQTGGYYPSQQAIPSFGPIPSEPGISNTFGTVAMALPNGGPGTATSQWFVNLADNTNLDNSSSGGPFTVFGKVAYSGMAVVDSIAHLPLGQIPPTFVPNVGEGDPAGGVLPLINFTGGTPDITNLVSTNTFTIVPALTYQVSSDNPSVVNPSISNGTLTLNYGSVPGVAHVTVTATDLGGNVVSDVINVGVGATQVAVGKGASKLVRFVDPDGTFSQVSIAGPGQATVTLLGTGLSQATSRGGITTVAGTPQSVLISTSGTTAASALTISGHGGNGVVSVAGITAGTLRAINGPTTALGGDLSATGSVASMTLNAARGGTITAASIGRLVIKGVFADNLDTSSLGSFAAGSVGGGAWNLSGGVTTVAAKSISGWTASVTTLARLSVAGALNASTLNTSGNINTISIGSLTGSNIYAGVALSGGQKLPAGTGNFTAADTIGSLHVAKVFADSNVAAELLGRVSLGTITLANGGAAFGIAGQTITALTGNAGGKKLHLSKLTSQSQVTAVLSVEGISPQDLVIGIV